MKMLPLLALLAFTVPAQADELGTLCSSIGDVGGFIMTNRQDGYLMSETRVQVQKIAKASTTDQRIIDMFETLVFDAYVEPQWGSENIKAEVVQGFKNTAELSCFTAFRDAK